MLKIRDSNGNFVEVPALRGKDAPQEAVLFTEQTLSEAQKTQAKSNIDAASTGELNQLKTDLTAEQTARANADQALANDIGDAWASGTTYAVGDYCIYGNQLYKCKTANTAGSVFSVGYWDAVSVGDMLQILSAKTSDLKLYTSADFASSNDAIAIHSSTSAAVFGRVAVIFIRCTVNSSGGMIVLPFSTSLSSIQYFSLPEIWSTSNPTIGWFNMMNNKIYASTSMVYGKEYSGMITTIVY